MAIAFGTLNASRKLFGFGLGKLEFAKDIIKDSLANMPSKLSGMFIVSLSVVLLASFGVDSAEVGIFYIAMMVSIVAGSFASSMAFMSIPASSELDTDLSSGSLRIGLALTVTVITALIVAPNLILSIIGTEYTKAAEVLVILAVGIFPSSILSNAMSSLNNLNQPKKILLVGSLRLAVFIFAFFVSVPQYGIIGAAYSILLSFAVPAVVAVILSRISPKYIVRSLIAILVGIAAGYSISFIPTYGSAAMLLGSLAMSSLAIFLLKCISIKEIGMIIASASK